MSKIGFISTMLPYPWGGSELLWFLTASEALRQDHAVMFSMLDWGQQTHSNVKQLIQQGAQYFPRSRQGKSLGDRALGKLLRSRPTKVLEAKLKTDSLERAFNQYISSFRPTFDAWPDVICVSQGGTHDITLNPDLADLLLTKTIPYIIVCQFNADVWMLDAHRTLVKQIFNKASAIAFVSQNNLTAAERHLAQSLPHAVVLQNPVNLSQQKRIVWPTDTPISFASVARLETIWKGQDILLEVLSKPEWQSRNWRCNFYGSGPDRDYLDSLASFYGIRDRIDFKGHVSDVGSIWAENHLLVLPSKGEGTPLALIEAMICGRPSVVTDVGGNTEWIEESRTGFIAEAPTARYFGAALERAWLSQKHWQAMGEQAHWTAQQRRKCSPAQSLLHLILNAVPTQNAI